MSTRKIRIVSGAIFWAGLLAWLCVRYVPQWLGESNARNLLANYLVRPASQYDLEFAHASYVRISDPIFYQREDGSLVQVGVIRQIENEHSQNYSAATCDWASATFFSSAPEIHQGDFLTLHYTPTSMDWVARFLFPPERQAEIARLVTDVYQAHSQEIFRDLQPILQTTWQETSVIIRDELIESLASRQPEFERLADRYRIQIVEKELLPVIGQEVWPIVLKEAKPVLENVGQQIWRQASIFRFGWRAIYDASPLPQRDLTSAEFSRFVQDEAVPVLTENLPLFLKTQQSILQQIIDNAKVQQVFLDSLESIGNDPEAQNLILNVLRDAIFENDRLGEKLIEIWQRPEVQNLMALTDARLEPTVVEIGEKVFGSPYKGVTPEFARILRNKILQKDQRWLILHKADRQEQPLDRRVIENEDAGSLIVLPGESTMENPFYYPARPR